MNKLLNFLSFGLLFRKKVVNLKKVDDKKALAETSFSSEEKEVSPGMARIVSGNTAVYKNWAGKEISARVQEIEDGCVALRRRGHKHSFWYYLS